MTISCPKCGHQGKVDPSKIPPQGAKAKCPKCQSGFLIRKPTEQQPATPAAPPVAQVPAASPPGDPVTAPQAQEPSQQQIQPPEPMSTDPTPPSTVPSSPEPSLGFAGGEAASASGGGLSLKAPSPEAVVSKDVACTGCLKLFKEDEVSRVGDRVLCQSCQESMQAKAQTPASTGSRPAYGMSSKQSGLDYAGFWIRVGAYLVDGFLLGLIFWFVISPFFMKMFSSTFSSLSVMDPSTMDQAQMQAMMAEMTSKMMKAAWLTNLVNMVIMGGYFIILEGGPGQTLGKKALGLRVVTADGDRIGYLKAFARYVGRIISAVILFIGFIMVAFDSEKRALHDRMVDSRVIRV